MEVFKNKDEYMEYWQMAYINKKHLSVLRPEIFKIVKAYASVDLNNDTMAARVTADIVNLLDDVMYDRHDKNKLYKEDE